MAFAAARMIKDKAKRPSTDFALYPVSPILRQNITENWPCHEVEPKKATAEQAARFPIRQIWNWLKMKNYRILAPKRNLTENLF